MAEPSARRINKMMFAKALDSHIIKPCNFTRNPIQHLNPKTIFPTLAATGLRSLSLMADGEVTMAPLTIQSETYGLKPLNSLYITTGFLRLRFCAATGLFGNKRHSDSVSLLQESDEMRLVCMNSRSLYMLSRSSEHLLRYNITYFVFTIKDACQGKASPSMEISKSIMARLLSRMHT